MKKIVCILVLVMAGGTALSQAPAKLSLKQCVETGIANNLQVYQAMIQVQRDEINWKQSKWDKLPDLSANINHGINSGRSIDPFTNAFVNQQISFAGYGANSGIVLFNGFSMQNAVKQNRLSYDASKMDWQQAKDNLTINIILAYLQVLSSEDALEQSRNQAALSKQQVERLEVLNREGAIPPSQLSDLKGQYAGDQLGIIAAQNTLQTAKLSLAQLMNVAYDKNLTVERLEGTAFAEKYDEQPEKIKQTALQQFAQVKAADFRTQSALKGVKVAKGQLFPTLSLGVNVNTNFSSSSSIGFAKQLGNNRFTTYGLNLRIPVFNSFQQRNRVKLAELLHKNNEAVASNIKTQLQQAIDQAYVNMNTAIDRYKILLEQVAAFQESFRAAEARFTNGVGNSIDYLTAKNNLDRVNLNLINAKYDFVLRTKVLDYYQGKPIF